jgi:hypothetical protein
MFEDKLIPEKLGMEIGEWKTNSTFKCVLSKNQIDVQSDLPPIVVPPLMLVLQPPPPE